MQFDVAMSPCRLASILDVGQLDSFSAVSSQMYRSFEELDECKRRKQRCWGAWKSGTKQQILKMMHDLETVSLPHSSKLLDGQREHLAHLFEKLRHGILGGSSDLFYIPREAFEVFSAYAAVFKKHAVDMEIAQPTLLTFLPVLLAIGLQSFDCHGSCCEWVREKAILSRDFVCGHRINYHNTEVLRAVTSLINPTGEGKRQKSWLSSTTALRQEIHALQSQRDETLRSPNTPSSVVNHTELSLSRGDVLQTFLVNQTNSSGRATRTRLSSPTRAMRLQNPAELVPLGATVMLVFLAFRCGCRFSRRFASAFLNELG